MKQFIKKLCLLTLFITAILPLNAESFREGDVHYTVLSEENKTVEASWVYDTADVVGHELVLPSETSNGYEVVKIASCFFSGGHPPYDPCLSITSILIPESVTEIGDKAFWFSDLASIVIPNSVTKIGQDAFNNCSSLSSVEIKASEASIGKYAFQSCKNLNKLIIASKNLVIEDEAFKNCTEIIKIECHSEIPPTCRYRAFADVNKELCRLYVPKGSEDLYRDAYQWMEFQQIYATLEHSSLERIEDTDKDKDVIAVYDVNGCLTTPDMPGIVIKRYSDGSVKKVFNN